MSGPWRAVRIGHRERPVGPSSAGPRAGRKLLAAQRTAWSGPCTLQSLERVATPVAHLRDKFRGLSAAAARGEQFSNRFLATERRRHGLPSLSALAAAWTTRTGVRAALLQASACSSDCSVMADSRAMREPRATSSEALT